MVAPKNTNPDFLNGVPELLILRLLSQRSMHGYDVLKAIHSASDGELEFMEGSIYPVLHRLERQGLLATKREQVGGRLRIVYRVTSAGTKRLTQSKANWEKVIGAVRRVLQGGNDVSTAMA